MNPSTHEKPLFQDLARDVDWQTASFLLPHSVHCRRDAIPIHPELDVAFVQLIREVPAKVFILA